MSKKRLLLAGGGTGGHLFPAMAVARVWAENGGEVLFVGSKHGMESKLLPEQGWDLVTLPVEPVKNRGPLGRILAGLRLLSTVRTALSVLNQFRPHVVLGVGGYASAPAVMAAHFLNIPVAIHEQNAIPGLANRFLSRFAARVLVTFPGSETVFAGRNPCVTGNPVRREFLAVRGAGREEGPFRLLAFAGSQGAESFNRVVPEALALLQARGIVVEVVQQARGEENVAGLSDFYRQHAIPARVLPFISEMTREMARADLVMCRAGATSLAELMVMGKPALLVPYPFAADDHQTANARALATAGGAWMQPQNGCTPQWLAAFLEERIRDRAGLEAAGEKARALAKPDAAEKIVAILMDLCQNITWGNSIPR